jgi:tRNA-specific 2-thiouridylase
MQIDFGLDRAPREARIVVAMSGGVDSSVVAALAARTGAEVIGVTLQLYDHGEAVKRSGSCCAGQDIYDARTVADRLGIAHYVLDYESRFRSSVIEHFADEYARGRTPVPCSLCNQGVKFVDLVAFAQDLGADCLATGHYVRRVENCGRIELHKGADPARDQSYFLYGTTQEQLDFLRFPLGDFPKSEVRKIAEEGVGRHRYCHNRVARTSRALLSFTGHSDLGAVLHAVRKLEVNSLAVRERYALRLLRCSVHEGHR